MEWNFSLPLECFEIIIDAAIRALYLRSDSRNNTIVKARLSRVQRSIDVYS